MSSIFSDRRYTTSSLHKYSYFVLRTCDVKMRSKLIFFFLTFTLHTNFKSATAISRVLSHDEHHSQRPVTLPKALTTIPELTSYLAGKGMRPNAADPSCDSYPSVLEVRQNYQQTVNKIVAASTTGAFKGQTYDELAKFVDTYDIRISGGQILEDSIDYVEEYMKSIGATNLQSESVNVPAWVRGFESATLLTSRGERKLAYFGLGQSVSTPDGGITDEAAVFNSYEELLANLDRVKGKIAVLDYGNPDDALDTTNNGYPELAKAGALAALYRSAATFSLNSAHARRSSPYYDGVAPEIPIGYLSFEAADLLTRLAKRGETIIIRLVMQNRKSHEYSVSRNIFGDLTGREIPEEFVILSAHTDSWDVSQAAQDDGVGVTLALKAFEVLKSLAYTPRRTLRLAFWTAEEYKFLGSETYLSTRGTLSNLSVALEADYSCLASNGLIWNGHPELGCVIEEISKLVGDVSSGLVVQSKKVSSDMDLFSALGIPVVTLLGDNGQYFWYHHTEADTMTAVNSTELDRCLAVWTSTAYILADLTAPLLRLPEASSSD